jgi:hypothetical protein
MCPTAACNSPLITSSKIQDVSAGYCKESKHRAVIASRACGVAIQTARIIGDSRADTHQKKAVLF